jgi:hypothetical protein
LLVHVRLFHQSLGAETGSLKILSFVYREVDIPIVDMLRNLHLSSFVISILIVKQKTDIGLDVEANVKLRKPINSAQPL